MREYLLVLFVAAATTYLLGGLVRRFASRIGAYTPIRDTDMHSVPIPRLGGLALLLGLCASLMVATNLPFLGSIPEVSGDAWAILAAGAVMALVGGIDDVVDLDPITKLAGQLVAAGIVVVAGIQLQWIPLPNSEVLSLGTALSALITTLAIVGAANAVNFVDGLDGLAAGIVGIGAAAFFLYSYLFAFLNPDYSLNRAMTPALITAALTGACLGILPHNGYPARVFMGDSGAFLLGTLLASSTISFTGWLDPGVVAASANTGGSLLPALLPLIVPFAALALPFTDMLLAVIRRTRKGLSPMSARDTQHLHHRMIRIGHSHPRAVLVMYLWTGLIAFGVILIGLDPSWERGAVVAGSAAIVVALTVLIPRGRRVPETR